MTGPDDECPKEVREDADESYPITVWVTCAECIQISDESKTDSEGRCEQCQKMAEAS